MDTSRKLHIGRLGAAVTMAHTRLASRHRNFLPPRGEGMSEDSQDAGRAILVQDRRK